LVLLSRWGHSADKFFFSFPFCFVSYFLGEREKLSASLPAPALYSHPLLPSFFFSLLLIIAPAIGSRLSTRYIIHVQVCVATLCSGSSSSSSRKRNWKQRRKSKKKERKQNRRRSVNEIPEPCVCVRLLIIYWIAVSAKEFSV